MADRKMQVERGNLAPYIVVNRDAAVAGVFSVDGEKGAVNLEGKYAKISDINSTNSEISKLKPRVDSLESGLKEINIKTDSMIVQQPGMATDKAMSQKATKDFYGSVLFGAGDGSATASGIMNPSKSMWWGAHNDYLYAKQNGKNYNVIQIDKSDLITLMGRLDLKSMGNYTSFNMIKNDNTKILFQTSPYKTDLDDSAFMSIVERDSEDVNQSSFNFPREGKSRTTASRQWVNNYIRPGSATSETLVTARDSDSGTAQIFIRSNDFNFGVYLEGSTRFRVTKSAAVLEGGCRTLEINGPNNGNYTRPQLIIDSTDDLWRIEPDGSGKLQMVHPKTNTYSEFVKHGKTGQIAVINGNTTFDVNGFLKMSSPVIEVYRYGDFKTNGESDGASVKHVAKGVYKISGVLGLNSDGAWGGTDGGIEIPLDMNKQPRLWVDYSVEKNGDITIKTFHREHSSSPTFAQNKIEGFSDGDPINIPADTFISVRVQMPENSKWNLKQKELEELNNKELDNGKEILNSDNQD